MKSRMRNVIIAISQDSTMSCISIDHQLAYSVDFVNKKSSSTLVDKLKDQGYALYIGKELEQSDIFPVLRIFLQTEDKRFNRQSQVLRQTISMSFDSKDKEARVLCSCQILDQKRRGLFSIQTSDLTAEEMSELFGAAAELLELFVGTSSDLSLQRLKVLQIQYDEHLHCQQLEFSEQKGQDQEHNSPEKCQEMKSELETFLDQAECFLVTLRELLEEAPAAHTVLVVRLCCMYDDLIQLSDRASSRNDYEEAHNMQSLFSHVNDAIDADLTQSVPGGCGRQRLQNIQRLLSRAEDMMQAVRSAEHTASSAGIFVGNGGAQRCIQISKQLVESIVKLRASLSPVSLLQQPRSCSVDGKYLLFATDSDGTSTLALLRISQNRVIFKCICEKWLHDDKKRFLFSNPGVQIWSAEVLRKAGFSARQLKDAGFMAVDLRSAGYTLFELLASGDSSLEDLRKAGYSAREMERTGFSLLELKRAKYSTRDLVAAGFSLSVLRAAGFLMSGDFRIREEEGDLTRVDSSGNLSVTTGRTAATGHSNRSNKSWNGTSSPRMVSASARSRSPDLSHRPRSPSREQPSNGWGGGLGGGGTRARSSSRRKTLVTVDEF